MELGVSALLRERVRGQQNQLRLLRESQRAFFVEIDTVKRAVEEKKALKARKKLEVAAAEARLARLQDRRRHELDRAVSSHGHAATTRATDARIQSEQDRKVAAKREAETTELEYSEAVTALSHTLDKFIRGMDRLLDDAQPVKNILHEHFFYRSNGAVVHSYGPDAHPC